MRKIFASAVVCLFAVSLALAQAPSPAAAVTDALENAWHVSLYGGYSMVKSAQTNNGFYTGVGVRLAKHWAARADFFDVASPESRVILGGGEYRFSLRHVLPPTQTIDTQKLEAFVSTGLGAGKAANATQYKFAAKVGGGVDLNVNETVSLRMIEVSYLRSSIFPHGGIVVGNNLQLASGLGFRF